MNGTITDIDGTFTLDAVVGGLLEVSYIGYKSEVLPVASGKALSVTLKEDTKMLEEVVVVGYGAMKKENLTGSVAQISGKALESRPVTNLSQALQGTVANLNISSSGGGAPGSTQNINIRGYTGFGVDGNGNMTSTSASPLIVIDGVQGGDINSINMEDVESISVLKDAPLRLFMDRVLLMVLSLLILRKEKEIRRLLLPIITILVWLSPLIFLKC